MKKLLFIIALSISLNVFSKSFKDGNYKFTIDYLTDLNTNSELEGVNSIMLQSSLNKITINGKSGVKIFTITRKEVSHDGVTEGDMEYTTTSKSDNESYLIIFKHRTPSTYSINLSSQGGTWWEFHITKVEKLN